MLSGPDKNCKEVVDNDLKCLCLHTSDVRLEESVTLTRFVLLVLLFNFVMHCIISTVVVACEIKLSYFIRGKQSHNGDESGDSE